MIASTLQNEPYTSLTAQALPRITRNESLQTFYRLNMTMRSNRTATPAFCDQNALRIDGPNGFKNASTVGRICFTITSTPAGVGCSPSG